MTDQIIAEADNLQDAAAQQRPSDYRERYRNTWRLRVGWAWARYLLAGRGWDVPELIDFVFNNYFFVPLQTPGELRALGEILAELRPQRALEVGTGQGGTLLFLASLAGPRATLASIDLEEGQSGGYQAERQWFYERFARRKQHLHLIRGDSHQFWMRRRLGEVFDGMPLDYLFLDGDHRYEGVKKDFEMYGPLVRKGGVIAVNDIVDGEEERVGGVLQFWNEIKSGYRHQELIEDPEQGGYGIGVLFVD
jgi:cephalosporin hydroxylase